MDSGDPSGAGDAHAGGVRLLCVGDLHIGRAPTRIADAALAGSGIDRRELAPAAAWQRLVELACERRVDGVVLLGDVVDEDNALLEALGPFGRGVRQLAEAGIPVVAVAGNHDVDALPRLVDATPGITLLGRGGTWESTILRSADGGAAVRLVGWSFHQRVQARSPLDTAPPALRDGGWDDGARGIPTVGLLHCDVDVAASHHAPVRASELEAAAVDAWLLGHIHRPDLDGLEQRARPVGYLGSVAALDPGEAGWHGAWMAHCSVGGVRMERVPVARHRYERVELDVGPAESPSDIVPMVAAAARRAHADLREELAGERVIIGRLVLTGSNERLPALLDELRQAGDIGDSWLELDGLLHLWEPRVQVRATRAFDLRAIAAGRDVAAPLARMALAATHGAPVLDDALRGRLREHLRRSVLDAAGYRDVQVELDDARLDALVEPALQQALDALERHRHGADMAGMEAAR